MYWSFYIRMHLLCGVASCDVGEAKEGLENEL